MKITYEQIMSFSPCYDPVEIGMPKDYEAELKDFIIDYRGKVKYLENIIWVCARKEFFNDRDLRLFGVWSALQVRNLMEDERSLEALEVSEKFAFGLVNENELDAARDDAWAAAWDAAWDAAWVAARDAAWDAAWAAARDAAWDAAWDAARAAARAAARDASAASAASDAVRDASAVWAAARDAQIETLLKMTEKPNGEWFKKWKEQQ